MAEDSFRWIKVVLGLTLLLGAFFLPWEGQWNAVFCTNEACVVRQEHVLRASQDFPFDARRPPAVVVEAATIGKNMKGERLALRYVDGSEVALVVDRAETVDAQANRLRAYFAQPEGSFALQEPHDLVVVGLTVFVVLLGLSMFLDGVTLLGWRRIRSDSGRHVVTIERVILGIPVKRTELPITPATTVGRARVIPNDDRFHWLTFEDPSAPSRLLPILDRPKAKAMIEDALRSS